MKCPNCKMPLAPEMSECPSCELDLGPYKVKRRKKMVCITAVIVVLAVIFTILFIVYKSKTKYNGRYDYVPDSEIQEYLDAMNQTIDQFGITYYIEIKGDKFKMVSITSNIDSTVEGKFVIDKENNIKLISDELTYKGVYDPKTKTITIIAGYTETEFRRTKY